MIQIQNNKTTQEKQNPHTSTTTQGMMEKVSSVNQNDISIMCVCMSHKSIDECHEWSKIEK